MVVSSGALRRGEGFEVLHVARPRRKAVARRISFMITLVVVGRMITFGEKMMMMSVR